MSVERFEKKVLRIEWLLSAKNAPYFEGIYVKPYFFVNPILQLIFFDLLTYVWCLFDIYELSSSDVFVIA